MEALIAVVEAGSMERAARGLYLTPSALTRRIQRLEEELGLTLLDRHFKPPKLTIAGAEVLEKARTILASFEGLKAAAAGKSAVAGAFRLGLSHALARPGIPEILIALGERFPLLQPSISSDVTPRLLERLHAGDLHMALVVLPIGHALPEGLHGTTLAQEPFCLLQGRAKSRKKTPALIDPQRQSWVLNPPGCLVREEIRSRVERLGSPLKIAAELYHPDLQLGLIAGKMGIGMMPVSLVQKHALRAQVSRVEHAAFRLTVRIACFRSRNLSSRETVVLALEEMLVKHYQAARLR